MEVSLGSHSDRRQSSSSCERTPVYRFPDAHMAANGRKKGALQGANRCSIGAQNYISIFSIINSKRSIARRFNRPGLPAQYAGSRTEPRRKTKRDRVVTFEQVGQRVPGELSSSPPSHQQPAPPHILFLAAAPTDRPVSLWQRL